MEENRQTPEICDLRQQKQVWDRVQPAMAPYPAETRPSPGANSRPCCMGSAAENFLQVLTGYIEEELSEQRDYLALSRRAPTWARGELRALSAQEGEHAGRLMTVYYLITGSCYAPAAVCAAPYREPWCAALRRRYHEEVCCAMDYARSAAGTTDVCLVRLMERLSADAYRHADRVTAMLQRSMGNRA